MPDGDSREFPNPKQPEPEVLVEPYAGEITMAIECQIARLLQENAVDEFQNMPRNGFATIDNIRNYFRNMAQEHSLTVEIKSIQNPDGIAASQMLARQYANLSEASQDVIFKFIVGQRQLCERELKSLRYTMERLFATNEAKTILRSGVTLNQA